MRWLYDGDDASDLSNDAPSRAPSEGLPYCYVHVVPSRIKPLLLRMVSLCPLRVLKRTATHPARLQKSAFCYRLSTEQQEIKTMCSLVSHY